MFGKKKKESFFSYYVTGEGRKVVQLAELFLEQMHEKIQREEITDFSRDYRFTSGNYILKLIYSERENNLVKLFVRDIKKQWNVLELRYCNDGDEVTRHICEAFYVHKKQVHLVRMSEYALFKPLLDKMKKVVFSQHIDIDIHIAPPLVEEANKLHGVTAPEVVASARVLLQQHRKVFDKKTFSITAHTIKTLGNTAPLLPHKNPISDELNRMIMYDLVGVIQEYVQLSKERRIEQEEKFLVYMNRFYLKALDVQEFNK